MWVVGIEVKTSVLAWSLEGRRDPQRGWGGGRRSQGGWKIKSPVLEMWSSRHLVHIWFSFFHSFFPPSFLPFSLPSFLSTSFPPFLSLSFLLFLCLTFHNIKLRKTYWISIEYSLFQFSNFKIFICKRKKKEIRNEYSSFWVGTLFY